MRIAFSLLLFGGLSVALAAPAAAADVALDNVTMTEKDATILYPHISVLDTNLTSDEVTRLFSGAADETERRALLTKMKAASLSIPETKVTLKNGALAFHGWAVKNIDSGKAGEITLAGADGAFEGPKRATVTIKAGPLRIQNADLASMMAGGTGADAAQSGSRLMRFTWSGFQATFPDKDTPADAVGGNLWRFNVGSVNGNASYQGAVPLKSSGNVKDIVIAPPSASPAGKTLRAFGYAQIQLGVTASGTYDPAKQAYSLDNYTVDGVNAGEIGVRALIDSLESTVFSAAPPERKAVIANGELQSFQVRIVDAGLLEKALAWFAAQRGQSVDVLRAQWAAAATLLIPIVLRGDPDGPQLASAVANFINKPNVLTISVKAKDEGLKLGDIQALFVAKDLLSRIDMQATAGP